jgi:Zn-dependent protease/predicted transcriptional regulator
MKWSISLGRLAGIPVYVHATFALLLAWVGVVHWISSGNIRSVVVGIVFILALFGCVLLHEFGHALAARRYGIRTRDITLLPIGGLARLEKMPDRPVQELWVALAGPAVNLVIAAVLLIGLIATRSLVPLDSLGVVRGSFAERLMLVNLFLVAFNMIPAFPMDGGRVLRALLAMRIDYARATRVAAAVGQAAAVVFGVFGLFLNPFLLLIALFVWIGAAQESAAVDRRSALDGVPVEAAMVTDYSALDRSDPAARAVEIVLAGAQRDFPVMERGRYVGVLTQRSLLELLSREGGSATIDRAVDDTDVTVGPKEMLIVALERMQTAGSPLAPVIVEGRIVGLLTTDNVVEFLSFRRALDRQNDRGHHGSEGPLEPSLLQSRADALRG